MRLARGKQLEDFKMQKLVAATIIIGALCSACSIDVQGEGAVVTETKTFQLNGPADLTLQTHDGAIEIRSWDRNEVSVEIMRRAASDEDAEKLVVNTTQNGNRIVVDAPAGRESRHVIRLGSWQGESVSFIVRAPRQLTLDAQTGDGSIVAGDLAGVLNLRSGDGAIRGERLEGRVKAHTGDGSIAIHDARGEFELDSGDGSVALSGRLDNLRVHTGDGSVSIDAATGSILKTNWEVTTGDGSVSVRLPANLDAEIEAESGDGRVHASWAPQQRSDDDDDRGRFRGRLGAGGPTLRIHTGDGSITMSQ
jgi:hypothetical protein